MRRAANRDKREAEIVATLRGVGASVRYWGMDGAPDLVVGFRGVNTMMEVKAPLGPDGGDSRDGQRLNHKQADWHRTWRGQVCVVRTPFGALVAIGAVKAEGGSMKYAVIVTLEGGKRMLVVRGEWGVEVAELGPGDEIRLDAKLFETAAGAYAFGAKWKGHPHWNKPIGFEVVPVRPKYRPEHVAYERVSA